MGSKLDGYFADLVEGPPPEGRRSGPSCAPAWPTASPATATSSAGCRASRWSGRRRRRPSTTSTWWRRFPGVRKLCILRDPRDRVVSFHHHQVRKGRRPDGPIGDEEVDEYVRRVRADYEGLLGMVEPYRIVTYEEMSRAPEPALAGILRFLEAYASEDHVRDVLESASFERLAERERGAEDADSYYRKGVVGDWTAQLDPARARAMVEALEPLTARIEERFGLDLASYRQPAGAAPQPVAAGSSTRR